MVGLFIALSSWFLIVDLDADKSKTRLRSEKQALRIAIAFTFPAKRGERASQSMPTAYRISPLNVT